MPRLLHAQHPAARGVPHRAGRRRHAADALEPYFAARALARGYVLDDRGRLRQHMAAFIDGRQIEDRPAPERSGGRRRRRSTSCRRCREARPPMSTRCHRVSPARGCSRSSAAPAAGTIARTSFLGDNVTLAMHDPRERRTCYAALNHGHFGVKLHRSTRRRRHVAAELPTPKYPEKPEGYMPKTPVEGTPADWSLKLVWALAPGGADEPGVALVRHAAGRAVPFRRRRRVVGAQPAALGRPAPRGMVRRRRRSPRHSLGLRRPARSAPREGRRLVRRRLEHARRRRDLGAHRDGHARRVHAARAAVRAERPGPAHGRAVPRQPGRAVGAAPQRHLPVGRRRGVVDARSPASSRRRSALPSPCIRATRGTAWFVPAVKDETRYPAGGQVVVTRTRDGGQTFETLRERVAAAARLRSRLPPRARRRRNRQRLAFGSTTGSLWVSENGGDSWQMAVRASAAGLRGEV